MSAGQKKKPELPREYLEFAEELHDLAVASQNGDEKKHVVFLNRITPVLRSLVHRHWWGDSFSHEDILQDILLIIHSKLHTYNPEMPIMPWIRSIAQYRILDCVRQFKRKHSLVDSLDQDDNVTFEASDTDKELHNIENMDLVMHALQSLPEKQSSVVYMLKVQGLSLEEVSTQTGMSISAVKVTAHRAYKSLAQFTREQLGNG